MAKGGVAKPPLLHLWKGGEMKSKWVFALLLALIGVEDHEVLSAALLGQSAEVLVKRAE